MAVQDSLFGPIVEPDHAPEATLAERFSAFNRANPHVYVALRDLALQLARRGRKRIGVAMLFEVVRWNYQMTTADADSDWKLNNDYRAAFARLLMGNEPELAGKFELRRSQVDA